MKYSVLAASLLLLAAPAAASNHTEEANPGLVKAGSPLYGMEVAVDNALVGIGLADAGQVAFERASEVAVAHERGNNEAMNRALANLNNVSKAATSGDAERLNQSISILQGLNETVPEEAQQGLSTALENVRNASEREPSNLSRGIPIPDDLPSVEDVGGDGKQAANRGQQ